MGFNRRTEFLPFSRPDISEAEIADVVQVLRSGWITTGAKAATFETAFASYCGIDGAVALASATAGMHVVFEALDIAPGDEVITPSLTWVSTPNLLVLRGAKPIFGLSAMTAGTQVRIASRKTFLPTAPSVRRSRS